MIIDTHAHLYYENIIGDIENILKRAADNGIEKIIVPAVDIPTSRKIIELAEKYDMVYGAAGFHPCDISKAETKDIDVIAELLDHEKVIAVGETGLDYYWDKTNIDKQKDFFRLQIELAKDKKLPIIIHTRDSIKDAIEMVKKNYNENLSGQFHCFSGDTGDLKEVTAMDNFYVSFCGNITYKKYPALDAVKEAPVERLLSETDSPFLAPMPNRGKNNEPANVVYTIRKIAEVKEMDEDELRKILYTNAESFYFDQFS
jgi:TatD DNase family protein